MENGHGLQQIDAQKLLEEELREAAAIGDLEKIKNLQEKGINLSSQNTMNGWTALHWASNRGHIAIVKYLLANGANTQVLNHSGKNAMMHAKNKEVHALFGAEYCSFSDKTTVVASKNLRKQESQQSRNNAPDTAFDQKHESTLPITPNYLAHPPFPYTKQLERNGNCNVSGAVPNSTQFVANVQSSSVSSDAYDLIIKVRVANSSEPDFIEVDLNRDSLTFNSLIATCCNELQVDFKQIIKVRKLPNTILRRDKEVARLQNYQELELVLKHFHNTNVQLGGAGNPISFVPPMPSSQMFY